MILEQPVREVPDSPVDAPENPAMPQEWQTVPASEIENTSLPSPLEPPKKVSRKPRTARDKRSPSKTLPTSSTAQSKPSRSSAAFQVLL